MIATHDHGRGHDQHGDHGRSPPGDSEATDSGRSYPVGAGVRPAPRHWMLWW